MIPRILQLQIGLMLFGFGLALLIRADLGADPWTVFHVGLAKQLDLSVGLVIQFTGAFFLFVAWALLREPIGLGSFCNMILVGPWINVFLNIVPPSLLRWQSISMLILALVVLGLATALYIAANLGAGPRDSIVLGLSRRSGVSIKYVRLGIELFALVAGVLLHGPVGFGTVVFAVTIGPIMQFFLLRLRRNIVPVQEKNQ